MIGSLRIVKLTCLVAGAAGSLAASSVDIYPFGFGIAECLQLVTGTAAATCYADNGAIIGNQYGTFQGIGHAQAGSGSLHADATANYLGATPNPNQNAYGGYSDARAEITDTLTLSGAPQSGFLRFNFVLDGTLTLTEDFVDPSATARAYLFANGSVALSFEGNLGIVSGSNVVDIPYYTLTPNIDILLVAEGYCAYGGAGPKPGNCFASADFSNTATIAGLGIADSNHKLVSGATITAASGYAYPGLGSSGVPEPSSLIPVASAVAVLMLLRRRSLAMLPIPLSPEVRRSWTNKFTGLAGSALLGSGRPECSRNPLN